MSKPEICAIIFAYAFVCAGCLDYAGVSRGWRYFWCVVLGMAVRYLLLGEYE